MTERKGPTDTAPLKNVARCMKALERAMERQKHLPGIVVFSGPAGYGKSFAAAYAANTHKATYIECKSTWTKKAILVNIAKEMGLAPVETTYGLTDQISEHLCLLERPLIIDEMDHIVKSKSVEIIRDLYEGSQVPILLIGEKDFPNKLKQWERFHSRVLDFVEAQAADLNDAKILAKFYARKVTIADDLLAAVVKIADGSIRRVCVNMDRIEEEALEHGVKEIDLAKWQGWQKGFSTGQARASR